MTIPEPLLMAVPSSMKMPLASSALLMVIVPLLTACARLRSCLVAEEVSELSSVVSPLAASSPLSPEPSPSEAAVSVVGSPDFRTMPEPLFSSVIVAFVPLVRMPLFVRMPVLLLFMVIEPLLVTVPPLNDAMPKPSSLSTTILPVEVLVRVGRSESISALLPCPRTLSMPELPLPPITEISFSLLMEPP